MTHDVQESRKTKVVKNPEDEEVKRLVLSGLSQGLSAKEFRSLLDCLELRFIIRPPVYMPGAAEDWNAFHGGQADAVKYIKYVLGEVKYGE